MAPGYGAEWMLQSVAEGERDAASLYHEGEDPVPIGFVAVAEVVVIRDRDIESVVVLTAVARGTNRASA